MLTRKQHLCCLHPSFSVEEFNFDYVNVSTLQTCWLHSFVSLLLFLIKHFLHVNMLLEDTKSFATAQSCVLIFAQASVLPTMRLRTTGKTGLCECQMHTNVCLHHKGHHASIYFLAFVLQSLTSQAHRQFCEQQHFACCKIFKKCCLKNVHF